MKKIGIIGGGREGQWWEAFLQDLGHKTLISDRAETNGNVIGFTNVIFLAVPISASASAAEQIIRWSSGSDKLIVSVCGLMTKVENALAGFPGDILFLHRMIGPQVKTMSGHNMIVNDVGLSKWQPFVQELIKATEADVIPATSEEHDDMVGLTQAIARIVTLALGIVSMEAPLPAQAFTNVPFTGLMAVLARILDFKHMLSRDMVLENPFARKWIDKLHDAMLRIESESEDFEELFTKLEDFLGTGSVKAGSAALATMPSWWGKRSA
ncbi:MAG: hypothetical protein V4438_02925 [Patescibacteria group bacterium]